MEQVVLEVKDLKFKYRDAKKRVLNGLNFQVKKGEFLCIIGQNGSGKSTLCNALVGLIPYYFAGKLKGQVLVDGIDTQESTIAELSSKIGLVFQNPFNQLSYTAGSVAEELAYGLGNKGVPREKMVKKVEYVAKLMRIDTSYIRILWNCPADRCSGLPLALPLSWNQASWCWMSAPPS